MDRLTLFIRENLRLLIGAIVVVFVVVLLLTLVLSHKSTKVIVGGKTFSVTVAKTEKEKQVGLSERKSLNRNNGMLFIFDKADYYAFWMKNMQFPIDIIYIHDGKVVYIVSDAQPVNSGNLPIYQPSEKADKVLEINSGLSKQYGFKNGTKVLINNLK